MQIRSSSLGDQATIMKNLYERINKVHKRPLHSGQIQVAQDYFVKGKRVIMSQWGRNGGKTEDVLYIADTAALLNDHFWVMIVCPQLKQGKKIYWHKKRLQSYAPPMYIKDISSTDMRVEFHNDSLITVEGCENYEALRGAKPNLVIYDEFQHHSREFHLEVMEPNLVEKSSSLIIFGTPPKQRSAYYVEFREELLEQIKDGHPDKSYYEFPSEINPVNDKQVLAEKRAKLIKSGNEVIWQREYEGKLVFGGEGVVFPDFSPHLHMRRHAVIMSYLEADKSKLKWFTICDPGSSTCFAVIFVAYNPYTQQVYLLDEIYEKDRKRTNTRIIWGQIIKKQNELLPNAPHRTWKIFYDEAAAWFQNEVMSNYKVGIMPTDKHKIDEEDYISRIKMLMTEPGALHVSERCYWWRWEIESYITTTNQKGDIVYPDINNHLIDCSKYLMQATNWKLLEKADTNDIPQEYRTQGTPHQIDPNDWSDNAVHDSLNIGSVYDEYF